MDNSSKCMTVQNLKNKIIVVKKTLEVNLNTLIIFLNNLNDVIFGIELFVLDLNFLEIILKDNILLNL